jgi:hypothetical protein
MNSLNYKFGDFFFFAVFCVSFFVDVAKDVFFSFSLAFLTALPSDYRAIRKKGADRVN